MNEHKKKNHMKGKEKEEREKKELLMKHDKKRGFSIIIFFK